MIWIILAVAVLRWLIGVATDWRKHWRAQGVPLNKPLRPGESYDPSFA